MVEMERAPLSMVYRSEKQIPKLNQTLQEFYRQEEFCDITLITENKRLRAHRVILAAFSPYFYQVLTDSNDFHSDFNCQRFDEGSLKCLLDFCYSGVITVDSVCAEKLLSVATALQVKEVEKLCLTFLRAHQSFVCEIASEAQENHTELGRQGRNSTEVFHAESSGQFSPGTSPNVSTSGRPVSETGSIENSDLEIVNIKQESLDNGNRIDQSRDDMATSPLSPYRRLPYLTTQGLNVIDMTQISPSYIGTPYPRPMMFPRPPAGFQLFSPKPPERRKQTIDSCSASSVPKFTEKEKETITEQGESNSEADIVSQSMQAASLNRQEDGLIAHTCPICQQRFTSSQSLSMHLMLHDRVTPQFLPKRNRKSVSPQKHDSSVSDLESPTSDLFTCGTCGKSFKDSRSLKFHRYNHVLRHVCSVCGKRFSRSWNLQRHKKSHFKLGPSGMWHMSSATSTLGSETDVDVSYIGMEDEVTQDLSRKSEIHNLPTEPVDLTESNLPESSEDKECESMHPNE